MTIKKQIAEKQTKEKNLNEFENLFKNVCYETAKKLKGKDKDEITKVLNQTFKRMDLQTKIENEIKRLYENAKILEFNLVSYDTTLRKIVNMYNELNGKKGLEKKS